ncbi:MAG: hypothetical protein ABI934_07180 [Actinomycetota bacterium]
MAVVKVRSVVGISMIWLTAVAGVSVTAWVAIDRAGRDITDGLVSSLSPLTVGVAPATTSPASTATPAEPTTEPPAKVTISKTPVPSPPKISAAGKPSSPASLPSVASPTAQDGTFSATGGQVSVRCTGTRIQLRIAQPDDEWRVDVQKAGPDEVRVTFQRGHDGGEGGTSVRAVCVSGRPDFKVSSQS